MRALLSVSDKSGLVPLATALAAQGWELVSTGGTARALAEAGLPVIGISDVTGFPEMMDGRVKTLHPKVHGGILARRHMPSDLEAIAAHGIAPIDLVVVNLYPFAQAAAKPDLPFDALVDEIDIGGPSLLRAAAKNFRDVMVVVDPADYSKVIKAIQPGHGATLALRFDLARKAIGHTADYDRMIAATLGEVTVGPDGTFTRGGRRAGGRLSSARCATFGTAKIRTRWPRGSRSVRTDLAGPSSIRARNCRSRIFSTSMRPRGLRWSSRSRPRS